MERVMSPKAFLAKLRNRHQPIPKELTEADVLASWNKCKIKATRRGFIAGLAALSVLATSVVTKYDYAHAAYTPFTKAVYNALDPSYGITGNGSSDDSAAINIFLAYCSAQGAVAFFPVPSSFYNVGSTQLIVPAGLSVLCAETATITRTTDGSSSWQTAYGTSAGAMITVGNNTKWTGGIFNNTATLATSTTSATGNKGSIGTLGSITGGSSYTAGTYSGVSLTGGSGTGATANIVVSGGAVTSVTIVNAGSGYALADILSATAASIGGTGSGFSVGVAAVNIVFTVAAGRPNLATGQFIRGQSNSTPGNHMEGVATYSGTTLTLLVTFGQGTASTDWTFYSTGVWQSPFTMDGVTNAELIDATTTGNWYVGPIMSGWNPSTGGSKIVQQCKFIRSQTLGIFNRGFYLYGNSSDNTWDTLYVNGSNGGTDYCFNLNPANASGTVNNQRRTALINLHCFGFGSQGIAFGDLTSNLTCTSPVIASGTTTASVGILCEAGNNAPTGNVPSYCTISNPMITNVLGYGIQFAGPLYVKCTGGSAIVCGTGLGVTAGFPSNSSECAWESLLITGCTTGININASQVDTLLTGRATANTTNLTDNGTGTVHTGLITT